jgi:hypothetical protein
MHRDPVSRGLGGGRGRPWRSAGHAGDGLPSARDAHPGRERDPADGWKRLRPGRGERRHALAGGARCRVRDRDRAHPHRGRCGAVRPRRRRPGCSSRRRRGVRRVRGGGRRTGIRGLRRCGNRRHGREAAGPGHGHEGRARHGVGAARRAGRRRGRGRQRARAHRRARRLADRLEPRRPGRAGAHVVDREHHARLRRYERPSDQGSALRLAYAAHDGIALAVRPAHTHWDGDVAFAFGAGRRAGLGPAPGDGVERRRRGDPSRRPRGDRRPGLPGGGEMAS